MKRMAMTIREYLQRRLRRVMIIVMFGFALAIAGGLWSSLHPPWQGFFVLPGVVLFVLSLIYAWLFALRCPLCAGQWYGLLQLTGYGQGLWRIDPRIHFCPYCGRDIDMEVGTARNELAAIVDSQS